MYLQAFMAVAKEYGIDPKLFEGKSLNAPAKAVLKNVSACMWAGPYKRLRVYGYSGLITSSALMAACKLRVAGRHYLAITVRPFVLVCTPKAAPPTAGFTCSFGGTTSPPQHTEKVTSLMLPHGKALQAVTLL